MAATAGGASTARLEWMRNGEPEAVTCGLVEQLAEGAEASGVVRHGPALKVGDSIRVTAGPFAELLGTLERLEPTEPA